MAPFLMENSGDQERTYLFSFSIGLANGDGLARQLDWRLPAHLGCPDQGCISNQQRGLRRGVAGHCGRRWRRGDPPPVLDPAGLESFGTLRLCPTPYAAKHPALLSKLILPMLITSIGAGMIMPFMNVFFRQVYHQPDPVIGTLFAWGSLAMGIGLLIAPPLADRMGKIQLVVVTQALSIPFLILLGFAPLFWLSALAYYVRLALMNMSSPVYQTFVMERVEPSARATVASLVSMAWNFGWAFSPTISGWLQVHYGFGPPFLGTILLYTISIFLYWAFFWRGAKNPQAVPIPGD